MAANPLLAETLSRLPVASPGHRRWRWTLPVTAKCGLLLTLVMVQVYLYAWAKTEQERVDHLKLDVYRVQSQSRQKSFRYAQAINGFQISPDEEAVYQRLTLDRVDRVEVPEELIAPAVPLGERPRPKTSGLGLLCKSLPAEARRFWEFTVHGEEGRGSALAVNRGAKIVSDSPQTTPPP